MYIDDKEPPKIKKVPDIRKELSKSPVTTIIEDMDCFSPRRTITVKFTGPNIRNIIKNAPKILQTSMRTTGQRTFLDEYYVDLTDPNLTGFHIFWHAKREFDMRTYMYGFIRLKQGKIKPDGSGTVEIEFTPKVITEWEKNSILQRNPIYTLLLKIYGYIFYDNRRRRYVEQCKEYAEDMIRRVKDLLKLMESAEYKKA